MTRSPDESDEIRKLAERHLAACEVIYNVATSRNDIDVAAHTARSALSVALNCAVNLGEEPKREAVATWYERLSELYAATQPTSDYLSRAIKWATGATSQIFPPGEHDGQAGIGEGT